MKRMLLGLLGVLAAILLFRFISYSIIGRENVKSGAESLAKSHAQILGVNPSTLENTGSCTDHPSFFQISGQKQCYVIYAFNYTSGSSSYNQLVQSLSNWESSRKGSYNSSINGRPCSIDIANSTYKLLCSL